MASRFGIGVEIGSSAVRAWGCSGTITSNGHWWALWIKVNHVLLLDNMLLNQSMNIIMKAQTCTCASSSKTWAIVFQWDNKFLQFSNQAKQPVNASKFSVGFLQSNFLLLTTLCEDFAPSPSDLFYSYLRSNQVNSPVKMEDLWTSGRAEPCKAWTF